MSIQTKPAPLSFAEKSRDWVTVLIGFASMLIIVVPIGYTLGAIRLHLPELTLTTWQGWMDFIKEPLETATFEELLFRVGLFGWLRRRLNLEVAAVLSTLVFAATHIPAGIAMVFFATILGYICVKVYTKTESILAPVAVHFLIILAGMFLLG